MDFGLLGFKSRCCLFPRFSYIILAIMDVSLRSTWLLTYQPDCRAYVGASTFNKECFAFLISSLVSKQHPDNFLYVVLCYSFMIVLRTFVFVVIYVYTVFLDFMEGASFHHRLQLPFRRMSSPFFSVMDLFLPRLPCCSLEEGIPRLEVRYGEII